MPIYLMHIFFADAMPTLQLWLNTLWHSSRKTNQKVLSGKHAPTNWMCSFKTVRFQQYFMMPNYGKNHSTNNSYNLCSSFRNERIRLGALRNFESQNISTQSSSSPSSSGSNSNPNSNTTNFTDYNFVTTCNN